MNPVDCGILGKNKYLKIGNGEYCNLITRKYIHTQNYLWVWKWKVGKEDHRTLFWGVDKWYPCMKPRKRQGKDVLPHHFGCFHCLDNSNPTTPETYSKHYNYC